MYYLDRSQEYIYSICRYNLKNENNEMKNRLGELEKMFDTNKDVNINNSNNKDVEPLKEGENQPETKPINEEEILNNEEVK